MIRACRPSDMDTILNIWLSASIKAHDFIAAGFWQSKLDDMRNIYLPASETRVYEAEGSVAGFYSLYENTLAAIFVAPEWQGKGLGSVLLDDAKARRGSLQLTVYKANTPSIRFYEKHGFAALAEQLDEHSGHPELVMSYPS